MNNKKHRTAPKRASARTAKSAKRGASCPLRPVHPAPHMNTAQVRGLFSPFGIGGGLGSFSSIGRTVSGVPGGGVGAAEVARGAGGGGFLSFFNSIGGLDGIISTMGKAQKVFTIVKQIGPIFKLFGSFGGLGGLFGGGAKVKSLLLPAKAVRKPRSRALAKPARAAGPKRTTR
ncbi:hypothetical protein SAMN04487970_10418 [Paenibacillus tianmuensis]|uniref:Uncharacterized protein n=1 Tax=Paenibacillus tianmuensis TaxID=624147 RepID=A0A1G4T2I1_9BACL|nr:hypothetical protein [Paenibacillus tianmuensis]SCW75640.1 hypothetical protein SAMN04487970_10418 [Paenibacillus tianmuensis]